MIFTLTKTIKHGDQELTEIELREPTAKDIRVHGLPVSSDMDVKTDVVHKYIVTLAALPPSVVDQICARDFVQLVAVVAGFFGDSGQ